MGGGEFVTATDEASIPEFSSIEGGQTIHLQDYIQGIKTLTCWTSQKSKKLSRQNNLVTFSKNYHRNLKKNRRNERM